MRRPNLPRLSSPSWPLLVILIALGGISGCRRGTPTPVRVPALGEGYDTGPIDAHALDRDASLRRRVLGMSWREARGRLGALRFVDKGFISWMGPGDLAHEQTHAVTLEYDAQGGLHLLKQTPPHIFELVMHEDKCFVRQDLGRLRRKTPRDMDLEDLQEAAWAGLVGILAQFRGVTLVEPTTEVFSGREVVRYHVMLSDAVAESAPRTSLRLPLAPLPAWRNEVTAATLDGTVRVDVDSGVVLQAQLQGELRMPPRDEAPSVVKLRYANRIDQLGRVPLIAEPPSSIAEHLRPIRPRDPLAFFHHKGMAQKHADKAASGEGPADASPDALEGQSERDEPEPAAPEGASGAGSETNRP